MWGIMYNVININVGKSSAFLVYVYIFYNKTKIKFL
jgi:hypothetical protein